MASESTLYRKQAVEVLKRLIRMFPNGGDHATLNVGKREGVSCNGYELYQNIGRQSSLERVASVCGSGILKCRLACLTKTIR